MTQQAQVAELADEQLRVGSEATRAGSNPVLGIKVASGGAAFFVYCTVEPAPVGE